jgi:hypothetical protein
MTLCLDGIGFSEMTNEAGLRHNRARCRTASLVVCLALAVGLASCQVAEWVQAATPPTWDVVADDFESGSLAGWQQVSEDDLSLVAAGGHNESAGLAITVGRHASLLRQGEIPRVKEGYLTFWFNPNGVLIPEQGFGWIPGDSIRVAKVGGPEPWDALVALRVRKSIGRGYKAHLEWHAEDTEYDYESGEFDLADGWQKITLGFRVDQWVAVWLDEALVRRVSGVTHSGSFPESIELGKTHETSSMTPTGALRFDDIAFQIRRMDDLWVDAVDGDDGADGLTADTAFRTIQMAANLAGPGTTVHIGPGVYRESVVPAMSGNSAERSLFLAQDGPGTAVIRGSESSQSLVWAQLKANTIGLPSGVDPTNVYYADLSTWELVHPPRFVVELDAEGEALARLPLAREPDWQVSTEWKHHEFWWAADGGSEVAGCDPTSDPDPDCDVPWRSLTQLTDRSDDADPPNIEPGSLRTMGDLTGATLVAIDTKQGHYVYRRTIADHVPSAGLITVDEICELGEGSGRPGLGWGTKYYLEGKPNLLDTPGEWWYDGNTGHLYVWPPTAGDPATLNIEIARRDNGFQLGNRSYITLDGLRIELLNGNAIDQSNGDDEKSYHNVVRNAILRYVNRGIHLSQGAGGSSDNVTDGFVVENSEIAYIDTHAINLYYGWDGGSEPESFKHAGIVNTTILGNELHHVGFRTDRDSAVGVRIARADRLRFEANHVHHVAHNGIEFSKSVIQSPREWGFSPEEIKTGEILVKDNVLEKACLLTTDCGTLKFWGNPPDEHVFRDVLVTGNVFRDTIGWAHVSEKRGLRSGGAGSEVQGMGGRGLYVDMASGIHVYRNIAHRNAFAGFASYGTWRDGELIIYNNIAANSLYGFRFGGSGFDTHESVNTKLVNNILVNSEGYGILLTGSDGDNAGFLLDHNLYYKNGWGAGLWEAGDMAIYQNGGPHEYYQTLTDIQASTEWEAHGVEGDPGFRKYDPHDHELHDGSWPDFHTTAASGNTVDRGTPDLPSSLAKLLKDFGVEDVQHGSAFDVGRYEATGASDTPPTRFVLPGTTAQITLSLYPASFPAFLALSLVAPPPELTADRNSTLLASSEAVVLTVSHHHELGTEITVGRPTGQSAVAEAGGVELLYAMHCDAIRWPLPANPGQTYTGVKWIHLRRDSQSALYYWRRRELTPGEWWRSMRGRKKFAMFSWSAPVPFFGDLLRVIGLGQSRSCPFFCLEACTPSLQLRRGGDNG